MANLENISADYLRQILAEVDDLQRSTEQCSEHQAAASESLTHAADSLSTVSANRPDATASSEFAAADD